MYVAFLKGSVYLVGSEKIDD